MSNQQIIASFNNVDESHKHNLSQRSHILFDSIILTSKPGKTNLQFSESWELLPSASIEKEDINNVPHLELGVDYTGMFTLGKMH